MTKRDGRRGFPGKTNFKMFAGFSPHERKRTYWVLSIMTLSIVILMVDSFIGPSILSAEIWGYGFSAVFLILALVLKDDLLKKVFVFAVIAGFAELPADHYLVSYTKTLIYPLNEPMIWSSPAYMPFSWCVVLVEFGYISWLLLRKFGAVKSGLVLALLGACLVPLYEHWAISAGWWSYHNAEMWGPVPLYIILAEGLLMIPIPYFIKNLDNKNIGTVPFYALAEGVVMLIACLIAISIF